MLDYLDHYSSSHCHHLQCVVIAVECRECCCCCCCCCCFVVVAVVVVALVKGKEVGACAFVAVRVLFFYVEESRRVGDGGGWGEMTLM